MSFSCSVAVSGGRKLARAKRHRNELRGKAAYQAPELHTGGAVDTFLLDNFALGVIMFAMAVQDYPWACTQRGRCRVFDFMASSGASVVRHLAGVSLR